MSCFSFFGLAAWVADYLGNELGDETGTFPESCGRKVATFAISATLFIPSFMTSSKVGSLVLATSCTKVLANSASYV